MFLTIVSSLVSPEYCRYWAVWACQCSAAVCSCCCSPAHRWNLVQPEPGSETCGSCTSSPTACGSLDWDPPSNAAAHTAIPTGGTLMDGGDKDEMVSPSPRAKVKVCQHIFTHVRCPTKKTQSQCGAVLYDMIWHHRRRDKNMSQQNIVLLKRSTVLPQIVFWLWWQCISKVGKTKSVYC